MLFYRILYSRAALTLALIPPNCDTPTRHPMLGKSVINLRTINLLTYIILNNYLENINLQKYFIYIHRSSIYRVSFTCTFIFTLSPTFYIYTYKIDSNLPVMDSYNCVGLAVCGISRTSSSVPTRINTRPKLYSLVGIHKYGRPL